MNPRETHVNKTAQQRQGYWRYIEEQDYEPTVDEKLPFPRTGQIGEELAQPPGNRRRRVRLSTRLADHFAENWANWMFAVVAVVLLWLMTDSRVAIARMQADVSSTQSNVRELNRRVDSTSENLTRQTILINENKVRIDFLQRLFDRLK